MEIDSSGFGKGFLKELEGFADDVPGLPRQARDIAAWPGKAGDEPGGYRIRDAHHDDRDRTRRVLCSQSCFGDGHHQHIRLELDELGSELWKQLGVSLERHVGVAIFNPDVLSLNVAKIAEALLECLDQAA